MTTPGLGTQGEVRVLLRRDEASGVPQSQRECSEGVRMCARPKQEESLLAQYVVTGAWGVRLQSPGRVALASGSSSRPQAIEGQDPERHQGASLFC